MARGGRSEAVPGLAGATPRVRLASPPAQAAPDSGHDPSLDVAGRLAAALGHDLCNQLSAALNYSYLLTRALQDDPELNAHVKELQAATWRAAHLSQLLKLFVPARAVQRQPIDVNRVIEDTAPFLRRILEGHTLTTELRAALGPVRGGAAELEQVLVGLAFHARDALPRGSTMAIATRAVHADGESWVRVSCLHRPSDTIERDPPSRVVPGGQAPRWAMFRRALRRLGARLAHREGGVHVDLPALATQG